MIKKISEKSRTSSKQNLLLTGGSGSVGKELLPKIIDQYDVYAVGRKKESFDSEIRKHKNFYFIPCDFSKATEIPIKKKIDLVVHLGGIVAGKNISKEEYLKSNSDFTKILLNFAIRKNAKKLLFASSVSVYGKQKRQIDENSELLGSSDYAVSKIIAEKILLENSQIPVTIFRIASVYGKENKSFINKLIRFARKRILPFPVCGTIKKNFIYIDDLIEYILRELKKSRTTNKIFNIANPEKVSFNKLIQTITKKMGLTFFVKFPLCKWFLTLTSIFNKFLYFTKIRNSQTTFDLSPLFTSQEIITEKALHEFHYRPKIDIEKGIDKILTK